MRQTVGEFLQEKLLNMANWVRDNIENTSEEFVDAVARVSPTQATYFAEVVASSEHCIAQRDWLGLQNNLNSNETPAAIRCILHELLREIKCKELMHDKFWRYMELFRDAVKSDVQMH